MTRPMTRLLALDAGGTSTRAVVLDATGSVLGFGRAGGGNPTSRGVAGAVSAIAAAARQAMDRADGPAGGGSGVATLAMAGQQSADFAAQVTDRLGRLGWSRVVLQHDLLGAFGSGTADLDGYALIAGTGSVAARVRNGWLEHVVGGRGWLLGDAGSGFWIGHRVARAVVAALDGQADDTALVPLVLDAAGVPHPGAGAADRVVALQALMDVLYAQAPVQLAALAPLAFAVPADPTARGILVAASQALADLVEAVRAPQLAGPVVVGGSVVVQGLLAAGPELQQHLVSVGGGAALLPVSDGVLGTAVLALRDAGVELDAVAFERLRLAVDAARLSS